MELNDFLGIAIVGVALSLAYDYVKAYWALGSIGNKTAIIVLSLVVGTIYYFLASSPWYQAVLGILASASTVYALFLSHGKPV